MRRLAEAYASIDSTSTGAFANDSGTALLSRMHDGVVRLRVRRIGFQSWKGEVSVRRGYRDTIELGLGASPVCFSAVRLSTIDAGRATALLSDPRLTLAQSY